MSRRVNHEQIGWEAVAEFESSRPYGWQVFLPLKCQQIESGFCCLVHRQLPQGISSCCSIYPPIKPEVWVVTL